MNRMLHGVNLLLSRPDSVLEDEYRTFSRHIWMSYLNFRKIGTLGEGLFGALFFLTYEGAPESEKACIRDCLRHGDMYRKRLHTDYKLLESYILHTVRIMTGRCYLPSRASALQDAPLRKLPPETVLRLCEEDSLL